MFSYCQPLARICRLNKPYRLSPSLTRAEAYGCRDKLPVSWLEEKTMVLVISPFLSRSSPHRYIAGESGIKAVLLLGCFPPYRPRRAHTFHLDNIDETSTGNFHLLPIALSFLPTYLDCRSLGGSIFFLSTSANSVEHKINVNALSLSLLLEKVRKLSV